MSSQKIASLPQPASIGGDLRRARERLGVSLTTAADRTRISARYLEALEQDAPLDFFPATPYARFFLREYARFLGLDPEPLVHAYGLTPGSTDPSPIRALPSEYVGPPRRPQPFGSNGGMPRSDAVSRLRAVLPDSLTSRPTGRSARRHDLRFRRSLPSLGLSFRGVGTQIVVLASAAALIGLAMFGMVKLVTRSGGKADTLQSRSSGSLLPPPSRTLPRGGLMIFPKFRIVAFYGTPETSRLGILGIGPDEAARRLLKQAGAFRGGHKPVLPTFEVIATVALGHPGDDGMYRRRVSPDEIRTYLNAARKNKIYMLLDIQPGRSDFLSEAKVYEQFLKDPDVGLALDAEWHVGAKQVPGQQLGSVDAKSVNVVEDYLVGLVKQYHLPQKLFVIHRFTEDMIKNKERIKTPPELAVTLDVDGFGGKAAKYVKYQSFVSEDDGVYHGIKLYFQQDTDMMSPGDVLFLAPTPDFIVYQ